MSSFLLYLLSFKHVPSEISVKTLLGIKLEQG